MRSRSRLSSAARPSIQARCGASRASSEASVSRETRRVTGGAETIPAPRLGRDVLRGPDRAERPPQRRDRLLEAVIGDRDVLPADLNQLIFGQHVAGPGDERREERDLPRADRDRLAVLAQASRRHVELKRTERVALALWHRRIVPDETRAPVPIRQTCGRSQPRAEARITRPADRQPAAVGQHRDAVFPLVQLDPRQPIQVEQIRSVDPDELGRVERRLRPAPSVCSFR